MKISIVTPTFNSDKYLSETIASVVTQRGNFEIEYIIVDNESSDNTAHIIKKYESLINSEQFPILCNTVEIKYVSGKDVGMYDAINKGFALATGDIYAWLNSDDIYLQGAFATVNKIFSKFRDIHWIKGITSYIDEDSTLFHAGECYIYDRDLITDGLYGTKAYFIQQDSVFWRAALWYKCGPIDPKYKYAGDYYLWLKFAHEVELVSVRAYLSCFRRLRGQKSENMPAYQNECLGIMPVNISNKTIEIYFRIYKWLLYDPIRIMLFRIMVSNKKYRYLQLNNMTIDLKNIRSYKAM